jgi:NAD+ kinase
VRCNIADGTEGDHIKVTASKYPFPTVCADKASTDWFSSISRTLRWNEREKQKSFVVVEEDNEPRREGKLKKPEGVKEEVHEEEHEDEEEEAFDIDE